MTAGSALAARIEKEIAEQSLANGALLGTERDLCARLLVTPAVLRQATRILEARDIVSTKRGMSGGIYVRKTSIETVAGYVATLWELEGVQLPDLAATQALFRAMTFEAASRRMTIEEADHLRYLQEQCHAASDRLARSQSAIQREDFIASLSGNPLLVLSHAISTRFIRNMVPFEYLDLSRADRPDLTDQWVEALVAGNSGEANRVADAYVAGMFERLEAWRSAPRKSDEGDFSTSRPVWLARQIIDEIRTRGLPSGTFLGTEPDILSRFGVGRGTWRQALRLLEEHPAVTSRRGTGGGIYVASPDGLRAEQMIAAWLSEQGASFDDYAHIIARTCLIHIGLLCQADAATLHGLEPPHDGSDLGRLLKSLANVIAVRSGNRILAIFLSMFAMNQKGDDPRAADVADVARLRMHLAARDRPAAARAIRQLFGRWL
ncbi:MAG: hypothetical protein JWR77_1753 [Rhizorhabdus sp.]|nr:hypothetical protein [Rhizorhabdus sp.]